MPEDTSLIPLGGLVVEKGADAGLVVAVGERPVTVGRETSCEVRLTDTSSSRRHFRIAPTAEGGLALEDLGSANGTFVNGDRVGRVDLHPGDVIGLGETTIRFLSEAELVEALRQRASKALERDELTEASSRRMFDMRLRTEMALAARKGCAISLAIIDIDKLWKVNDRLGERGGDRVLQAVALGLAGYLGENDMLARFEEDSFAALIVDPSPNAAYLIAERMCAGIEGLRIDVDGTTVSVTASIGLASDKGRRDLTPEKVVQRAIEEVRRAKEAGGACVSRWVHPLVREPLPSVSGDLRGTVIDLSRKR